MQAQSDNLARLLLIAGVVFAYLGHFPAVSSDLLSVWLAGRFLADGHPDQVYAPLTDYFLMYPPPDWAAFIKTQYDFEVTLYPFLYPPLWAKVAALSSHWNFWYFSIFVLALNSVLIVGCVALAWRIAAPVRQPMLFIILGLAFVLQSKAGWIALTQNQPQILVSFLILLGIERGRKSPVVAGIAMALAASIKIYPALFALFWLATGQRRTFSVFVIAGAALGLISVLWAGWPLHRLFLDQVSLISNSVLVTALNFNLDTTIARIFFADALNHVPLTEVSGRADPSQSWEAMVRPPIWGVLSAALILAVTAALALAFRRADERTRNRIVWPLALTAVPLLLPLNWSYYFIPTLAFAPLLLDQLKPATGRIILIVVAILIVYAGRFPYGLLPLSDDGRAAAVQMGGFVAMAMLCFGFLLALLRPPSNVAT